MVETPTSSSRSVYVKDLARLEGSLKDLSTLLEKEFLELKGMIVALETRVRCLETSYSTNSALRDERIKNISSCILDVDNRLEIVERDLPSMKQAVKIMTWVGTLLMGSIVALIWSIITGQAVITFMR